MAKIQDNCFYYVEPGVPYEEARIRAACTDCKFQNKIPNDPMYWPGEEKGYGDYDLYCSICNKPINVREDNDDTPSV